jgi:hypothetical protein
MKTILVTIAALFLFTFFSNYLLIVQAQSTIKTANNIYPDETLIQSKDSNATYVIQKGKKCFIPDPETFLSRKFRWEDIKRIDVSEFKKIRTGPTLKSVKSKK